MIRPEWLKPGAAVGVTATSNGITKEQKIFRFQNGKRQMEMRRHPVIFTDNVFTADEKGRSSDGRTRGRQFNELVANKEVSAIIAAAGGDYLVEMLPYVDWELLQRNPKWIQGYSDSTSLLYTITTRYDIATAYGCHFGEFGMEQWQKPVIEAYEILAGERSKQNSFDAYEDGILDYETGLEGYRPNMPVYWKNGRKEEEISITGRLLGGCTDVLFFLAGTPYDGTQSYIERYKKDGILWYMETFSANSEQLEMHLWQLRQMGWFRYATGFVFGRPLFYQSFSETTYEEAVMYALGDLGLPIIFDADIGHKGPQFTMLNGIQAEITCKSGKGCIKYKL